MVSDKANCGELSPLINQLIPHLDEFTKFTHKDAVANKSSWMAELDQPIADNGIAIEQVINEIAQLVVKNGSAIPNPGCTSFITTGATNTAILAQLAGAVAAPQRIGKTAFNFLEQHSLNWLKELFGLSKTMQGIYSSGGSSANIIALGAARQYAFEKIGSDPAQDGITSPSCIYAAESSHKTIQRAAAVLGLGRNSIRFIRTNAKGQMCISDLRSKLELDSNKNIVPIAIVATAGTTSTGAIDPIQLISQVAKQHNIWLHVDGAYGLPGILDPDKTHLFNGVEHADSVIIDPHKWMGAPVGIGATFVRDKNILVRAFSQGSSDYLEGSFDESETHHSMQSMGTAYTDMGLELSAPSRGVVVWAILKELGKQGFQERICRHNAMAKWLAEQVTQHKNLELALEPTLSICCFRFVNSQVEDLNTLNRNIHKKLLSNNNNMPSTALINDNLYLRPCFIGAKTQFKHVYSLLDEVIEIGNKLTVTPSKTHLCKETL